MKQTDITMLMYPDPVNGYIVWWYIMGQDQESVCTRMELELEQDTIKVNTGSKPSGDGRVFIGRRNLGIGYGTRYASVNVDEVKMYNEQLSAEWNMQNVLNIIYS